MTLQSPPICRGLTLEACADKATILSTQAVQESSQIAENALFVDGFVAITAAVAAVFAWLAYRQTRKQANAAQDQLTESRQFNLWQKTESLKANRPKFSFGDIVLVARYGGHYAPVTVKVKGPERLHDVQVECELRSYSWATDPPTEGLIQGSKNSFALIEPDSEFILELQFHTRQQELNWDQGPGLKLDIELKFRWKDELGFAIERHFLSQSMTTLPFEPIALSTPIPSFYKDDLQGDSGQ